MNSKVTSLQLMIKLTEHPQHAPNISHSASPLHHDHEGMSRPQKLAQELPTTAVKYLQYTPK